MTAQTRTTNILRFEQGDRPQGTDYADLIDSFLSLSDSTAQSVVSNVTVPTITATNAIITTVSAATLYATTIAGAANITGAMTLSGLASATSFNIGVVSAQTVIASALTSYDVVVRGNVSAASLNAASVSAQIGMVSALSTYGITFNVITTVMSTAATSGIFNATGGGSYKSIGLLAVTINGSSYSIPFFRGGT